MSWYFKAGLSACMVVGVLALIPMTVLARYPYDNGHHYGQLWNPGHHYGQLKHQPPAVIPTPTPLAAPTPPAHNPHPNTGPAGVPAGPQEQTPPGLFTFLPDLSALPPVPGGPSDQIDLAGISPPGGDLDWMLLVILPALLAVWAMVFSRAVINTRRQRRATAPA